MSKKIGIKKEVSKNTIMEPGKVYEVHYSFKSIPSWEWLEDAIIDYITEFQDIYRDTEVIWYKLDRESRILKVQLKRRVRTEIPEGTIETTGFALRTIGTAAKGLAGIFIITVAIVGVYQIIDNRNLILPVAGVVGGIILFRNWGGE